MEFLSSSWHSYPKIYALGHRETKDIFNSEVIIQEKIDGSQISFGKFADGLKIKSKSVELVVDAPEKMFALAVERIKAIEPMLEPGWTYRGEYLRVPRHNTCQYERVPSGNIILFDINSGHEEYLMPDAVRAEAERLGLEAVPTFLTSIFFTNNQFDPTCLLSLLETISYLGGAKMEGIVIKNYSMFGSDKKVLMAKYVSESFKEVHKDSWKISNPGQKDVLQLIIASLRTEARWLKAVQHLRDQGKLEHSPKDIGQLIREVHKDVLEECEDYIKAELYKWASSKIVSGIKMGLPEWYKKYLIEETYKEGAL